MTLARSLSATRPFAWLTWPTIAAAFVSSLGIISIVAALATWDLIDFNAYWEGALRARTGQELWPPGTDTNDALFRYSSWYAWAWVPLTYLPRQLVEVGWSIVLLLAPSVAIVRLMR